MEKSTTEKMRLGIFVILGSILFIVGVYIIGSKKQLFSKSQPLRAKFDNVNGLQVGNNVRYGGIDVGTVKEMTMINDTSILVEMIINQKTFDFIKKDAIASIGTDGLVGNMVVNINPSLGNGSPVVAEDILYSTKKTSTDEMIHTLNITNKNAALVSTDLVKITNDIMNGQGMVGMLLQDKAMAANLSESVHYLKYTSKATTESIHQINRLITSLNNDNNVIGLLKDTSVAHRVKKIVSNFEKSTKRIDTVVQNLNMVVTNVKDGKGAINYLSNDTNLVHQIDTTMNNLKESSVKLNQNLEALKHNFLLRGYFRKRGMLD